MYTYLLTWLCYLQLQIVHSVNCDILLSLKRHIATSSFCMYFSYSWRIFILKIASYSICQSMWIAGIQWMFRAFRIGFTITGRNYTDELQDVNSREYEATAVEILAQVRLSVEPLKKRVLLLSSLLFFGTFVYNLDCLELLDHIRNNYTALAEMGDCLAHIHRLKRGSCCAPFWEGAGSPSNTMWPGLRSASIPSGIFIHPAVWPQYMGWKVGSAVPPFLGGELGSHQTVSPGSRPTSVPSGILIHPAVWSQQTWAKNWGLCPFWWKAGFPSNTMWPRSRPACMPSFILIHPTVWPQCTNVTDRQDI